MSLSKFYTDNTGFQATSVLDKSEVACDLPVWDSIVKDEPLVPEEEVVETPLTTAARSETSIEPQNEEETEPSLPAQVEEVEAPEISPPSPIEQQVTVDVETIEQNAFLSGVEAGRKQAEEEYENSAQTLLGICRELDALRETILRNSAGEMKELVLAISEKIIRHSVTQQDETIVATINDAIHLAVKSDDFQIQLNPEDLAAVKARKQEIVDTVSGLENIILVADPTVERGGCKLESTCCTVDASMTGQIKVIHDSIMEKDALSKAESNTEQK